MSETIVVQTGRFGEVRVPAEEVLTFEEGLLGFAERRRFVIIQEAAYDPFLWLQSLDDPELSFVIVDPLEFMPDYTVEIKKADIESLQLKDLSTAKVMVIVVVREAVEEITANLQGPLVINPVAGTGKQVVLLTDRYHTRHPIMAKAANGSESDQDTDHSEKASGH